MSDAWARMNDDPWVRAAERLEPQAREILGLGPDDDPLDLVATFERQAARAAEADARLDAAEFTSTSDNGLISVTITGRGTLLVLDIDDDAYVRYQPQELGPAILDTIQDAQGRCAELLREVLTGVVDDEAMIESIVTKTPGRRRSDEARVAQADWA